MSQQDLRTWLEALDEMEPVKLFKGAHWDLEVGAITKFFQFKAREVFPRSIPAVLFDQIEGYPAGYRVLANALDSLKRLAFTLGLPTDLKPMEFVRLWRERSKELVPLKPEVVKDGPVLENVDVGKKVNMLKFPTPKWHELDGGRYIGTGSVTITRDPDEGWVNLGTYRVQIHDEKNLGFWISPGQHGRIHREKYFSRGQPCKVAISFGHHPLYLLAGTSKLPWGFSEYEFVGALRKEPVKVILGEFTGLPIPADAELVIEGESSPGETRTEGPFGEWTGYYGSSARPEPVIKVKSVMYRNNPIIMGAPPVRGSQMFNTFLGPAAIWEELEKAGVPDVRGVWCNEAAGGHLIIIVSIKQRYPGHARQAALLATSCSAGARHGRYVIVVDEDIDPSNSTDLLWALATRSDPERSIEIFRRCWSTSLDTAIPREEWGHNSRAIIDACRPYEWMADFPKVVEVSQEVRERTWKKWEKELKPILGDAN